MRVCVSQVIDLGVPEFRCVYAPSCYPVLLELCSSYVSEICFHVSELCVYMLGCVEVQCALWYVNAVYVCVFASI